MGAALGGGTSGGARRQRALAEINVTPLVDVMLVLLIISMVAAPMLQTGINLELPAADHSDNLNEEPRLVVSIDQEAKIRINERPVHVDLLEERLERFGPDETVYLQAHKGLPYGEVLLLMDRIRGIGITNIALVTTPMEDQ